MTSGMIGSKTYVSGEDRVKEVALGKDKPITYIQSHRQIDRESQSDRGGEYTLYIPYIKCLDVSAAEQT